MAINIPEHPETLASISTFKRLSFDSFLHLDIYQNLTAVDLICNAYCWRDHFQTAQWRQRRPYLSPESIQLEEQTTRPLNVIEKIKNFEKLLNTESVNDYFFLNVHDSALMLFNDLSNFQENLLFYKYIWKISCLDFVLVIMFHNMDIVQEEHFPCVYRLGRLYELNQRFIDFLNLYDEVAKISDGMILLNLSPIKKRVDKHLNKIRDFNSSCLLEHKE